MAKLIKANGTVETVEPLNGNKFTGNELQKYVCGYYQILSLPDDFKLMVCNKDGKSLGLYENRQATDILYFNMGIENIVVGDVLVCEQDQL